MGIYCEKGTDYKIRDEAVVKLITYDETDKIKIKNNLRRVKKNGSNLGKYKKINSREYQNTETGEIYKYKENEYKRIKSLRVSMKRAREYLENNFNGSKNEIFGGLTYAIAEQDYDTAVKDFKDFIKKLKRRYKSLNFKYFAVIEKQDISGSWHFHFILKDISNNKLYIPEEELRNIWNRGHVWVKRIIDEEINNLIDTDDEGTAIEKLRSYMTKVGTKEEIPNEKRAYFKSRNVTYPKITEMTYMESKEIIAINNCEFMYSETKLIKSTDTNCILNAIQERVYNGKIKNKI